ncbi:hypothetical protein CAEBREN_03828 [Caenorhabditis brenneri]|uniref:Uncharacterized protein n=1 Tax=Caenorhabditis brenneri TaxID=135651 RepID=G0M7X0_CAEBE|nr:hypothetical protein CAEBREN_03828 [Caenorhabditis brenneri]
MSKVPPKEPSKEPSKELSKEPPEKEEKPRDFEPMYEKCERLQIKVVKFFKTSRNLLEKYEGGQPQKFSTKRIVKGFYKQAKTLCQKFSAINEMTKDGPELWKETFMEKFRESHAVTIDMANTLRIHSQYNTWPNFMELFKLAGSIRFEFNKKEFLAKMAKLEGAPTSKKAEEKERLEKERKEREEKNRGAPGCIPYIDELTFQVFRRGSIAYHDISLSEMKQYILRNRDILKLKDPFAILSTKFKEIKKIYDELVRKYGYADMEARAIQNKELLSELHDATKDTYNELNFLLNFLTASREFYPKRIKDAIELAGGICQDVVDKCVDYVLTKEPLIITVLDKRMSKLGGLAELLYDYADLLAKASRSPIGEAREENSSDPAQLPLTSDNASEPQRNVQKATDGLEYKYDAYRYPYARKMNIGSYEMEQQVTLLDKKLQRFNELLDSNAPKRTGNDDRLSQTSYLEYETDSDDFEWDIPVTVPRREPSIQVQRMARILLNSIDQIQKCWGVLSLRTNFHSLDCQGAIYQTIEEGKTKTLELRAELVMLKTPKLNFKEFKDFVETQQALIESLRRSLAEYEAEGVFDE